MAYYTSFSIVYVFEYKNNSQRGTGVPLAFGCSERYNMICEYIAFRSSICRSGAPTLGRRYLFDKNGCVTYNTLNRKAGR